MENKLKIDFYKIQIESNNINKDISFDDLLKTVYELPQNERTFDTGICEVFVLNINYHDKNFWEGDIIWLRTYNLPKKGNKRKCVVEDIVLNDDEAISEHSAFLYHPRTKALAIQASQHSISLKGFIRYFEAANNLSDVIVLEPILNRDAMEKLARMTMVQKFEFRIAGLKNAKILANSNPSVDEAIDFASNYDSSAITIKLTTDRKRKSSLDLNTIRNTILELLNHRRQNESTTVSIRISGLDEEEEKIHLNLLRYKMQEVVEINKSKKSDISYFERQFALREAWNRRKEDIFEILLEDD